MRLTRSGGRGADLSSASVRLPLMRRPAQELPPVPGRLGAYVLVGVEDRPRRSRDRIRLLARYVGQREPQVGRESSSARAAAAAV